MAAALATFLASSAKAPTPPPKHGLSGSYYAANTSLENDVPDKVFLSQGVFYSQVWSDKNDFELPRPLRNLESPMAGRVDPQVAFGQGKGFIGKREGPSMIWWPTGFPVQPGSFGNDTKPWENLAAVIWKGFIHLPKAGTYYFTTVSNGASAVYLNQARVALNGHYGGALASDAFSYAKEGIGDFVQNLSGGNESAAVRPNPGDMYVIPVPTDAAARPAHPSGL